jgi:hypothetical protein
VQCAGPRCQPSTRGRPSSDLHGPPAAIHKRRQGATPEYVQWARTAPHVITHIATLSGADPTQTATCCGHARPTGRHRTRTTLTCCWYGTRPPARSWVEPEKHALVAACAGVYRQRQGAGSHDPSNPPPPAGGATATREAGKRFKQAARGAPCTPHGTAWSTRSCPSHRAAPRPPVPRHMGQHHLHGRITPACQPVTRRAIVHAVRRSNLAAPARWLPRVTLIDPGTRQAETPSTTRSWQRSTRPSGIAPDAAHHRNRLLVCALSNTQGRAPPSAGPHAPPRGDTGANQSCARGWHRVWNH